MSEITLNSLGSGRGNLVITFTDSVPDDTIEYVIFIVDSSNNIVATESFTLEQAHVEQNGESSTITWNYGGLTNGETYTVQIGKNKDELVMFQLAQMSQKVYNFADAPVVYVDHSGSKLTVNWEKVYSNGSEVTQYNIYSAELNNTNLTLDANWNLSKMDTSGTNILVPYNNEANDLYVKVGSNYIPSVFGNLKKLVTTDYIIESTLVGNYIIVTSNGLTDLSGNPISDISGNLYDSEGVALLDFSGNMINIEDDTDYVISADGNQVLANSDQVAIKYPDGAYIYDSSSNIFIEQKYGIYNKINNVSYIQANNEGYTINSAHTYANTPNEPTLNLLYVNNSDFNYPGVISKLGKLYDLSGNAVYDLSGNHVNAVNESINRDVNGQPILTLLQSVICDASGNFPDLISNYNGHNNKVGYQVIKHQGNPDVGFLVTAVNSAGEFPEIGKIIMPYSDDESTTTGQVAYASIDAPNGLSVKSVVDGSGIILSWTVPHSNGQLIDGYLIVVSDLSGNSSYGTLNRKDYNNDPKKMASISQRPGTEVSLTIPFDNDSTTPKDGSLQGYFNPSHTLSGNGIQTSTIRAISSANIKNYSFKLVAVNDNVDSEFDWGTYVDTNYISNFSNSASIIPSIIPRNVNSATITRTASGELTITIDDRNQNANSQPILGYVITYMKNNQSQIVTSSSTTKVINGLTNGTNYEFKIFARNAKGLSLNDYRCSGTPIGPPGAPILHSPLEHGSSHIKLTWEPSNDGGMNIQYYKVYRSEDNTNWTMIHQTSDASGCLYNDPVTRIEGYYYYVVAHNSAGDSEGSNSVYEYTSTTPGAPSLNIVPRRHLVTLEITPPNAEHLFMDERPLITYSVFRGTAGTVNSRKGDFNETVDTVDTSGNPMTLIASNIVIDSSGSAVYIDTNVELGTAYYYKVAAVNRDGQGDWNLTPTTGGNYVITTGIKTPYVVPCDVPYPITNLIARTNYNNSTNLSSYSSFIDLAWQPPLNEGAPLTSYVLYVSSDANHTIWKKYVDCSGSVVSPKKTIVPNTRGTMPNLINYTDGSGNFINNGYETSGNAYAFGTLFNSDGSNSLQYTTPDASGDVMFRVQIDPSGYTVDTSGNITQGSVRSINYFQMGTEYAFKVVANNVIGASPESNVALITPSCQPLEPLNVTTSPGDKKVTLNWDDPLSNGGSPILSYFIYDSSNNVLGSVLAGTNSYDVTEDYSGNLLVNETQYTFKIKALNKNGFGPASANVSDTPYAIPLGPLNLSYDSQNGKITARWEPPANAADLTNIFSYEYKLTNGPQTITEGTIASNASLVVTIDGLTNGTIYTFSVRALGSNGIAVGEYVTLDVKPTYVSNTVIVTLSKINNEYTATWTAPSFDGGSPIITYLIVWHDAERNTFHKQTLDASIREIHFTSNKPLVYLVVFALNANGASPISNIAFI